VAATPIPVAMAEAMEPAHNEGMDAASNLAADVNFAAEALDNLRRLLRRQFPDAVLAGDQRAPELQLEAAPTPENPPCQSLPMTSAHALPQVPSLPPADLAHAVAPRRFGVLGFLVGIALSAAIGAVAYIYLAAG
jgi:hypothetical protein